MLRAQPVLLGFNTVQTRFVLPVCVPAAYKVTVKSTAVEGDFMIYTAAVVEVLKKSGKDEMTQTVACLVRGVVSRSHRRSQTCRPPQSLMSFFM